MNNIFSIIINPQQDLFSQLKKALLSHSEIEVDLDPPLIEKLLPQVIHQVLTDGTIRTYIEGVYLKRTEVRIEEHSLYFDVNTILDFIGVASFLGRNKNVLINGQIMMVSERPQIQSLNIQIPNLGFFQKGLFHTAKSSIIDIVLKTDLNKALILALRKEKLPVEKAVLRIEEQMVQIVIERTMQKK